MLYISPYILRLVDGWIDCPGKGKYRKPGVSGDRRISIINAEMIMNDRSGIYHNRKSLRAVVTAMKPVPADLPWAFCLFTDVLHPVIFAEY